MRIMAVSDRIIDQLYSSQVGQRYNDIDLIVGCGDLPFFYLDFLLSSLNTTLVYVRGNHDRGPQFTANGLTLTRPQGGTDLHGQVMKYQGLLIAGLEGSMRYKAAAPLMYSESEMAIQVARLIPKILSCMGRHRQKLDIMIAHSPPFGIHDEDDLAHRGFKTFIPLIRFFKPRFFLHGHVHVYRNDIECETVFGETTIINVYPLRIIDIEARRLGSDSFNIDNNPAQSDQS